MPTILSIDFDYFCPEDPRDDWGHRESEFDLNAVWGTRLAHLLRTGRDPRRAPHMAGLFEAMPRAMRAAGWRFSGRYPLAVAESHASAYTELRRRRGLRVINVDAHHDWFYGKLGKGVACGNWLGVLASQGKVDSAVQVYPEWRRPAPGHDTHADTPSDKAAAAMKRWTRREPEVVYGWEGLAPETIDGVFIARSGCWSPPWLDPWFFRGALAWAMDRGPENVRLYTYPDLESFVRPVDWAGAERVAERVEAMVRKIQGGRPLGATP